ncbi:uncharacterized protein LOC132313148 isoform X1 [Cornus florida]|uniref:uncharacterized protein LOC132313148 isoform X1 n=1 Tax=Cornus florida TaxID=4283 RepID=UPI002898BE75|nr:uncharacterized protein LOC132313148 isoform X1 [Cornus florida]
MPARAMMAADQAWAVWRRRLGSAFRTALACAMVGCITLYGPSSLQNQLAFPAFSYVTAVIIVSDATLGDSVRGCWHALYATVQVVPPSMLSLWVLGPARFSSVGLAAIMVALSAFAVALPESTHLMAKRIAFGQIVIVYVGAVIHGDQTGAVMHPLHVASSTALGAFASVLALLLPYPRLACCEVRKLCRLYAENASERINLFMKAFCAQDNPTAVETISQAKPLAETGTKFLQSIKLIQEGVMWERPNIRLLKPGSLNPGERLQEMEMPIRGMEIALTSPSFPVCITNQELSEILLRVELQISLKLEQAKRFPLLETTTAPEMKGESLDQFLQYLKINSATQKCLPAFFFLFCLKLLQDDSTITQNIQPVIDSSQKPKTEESRDSQEQAKYSSKRICTNWHWIPRNETLVFAFKCSLSLGLAVLFGLLFNKENGYWSGLTIAISFATGRQATFTVANARAQGTAMGSVYGVVGCFIFQRFSDIRFLPLLPWIIFTSFLRHSSMYGQAGGISAVIGALLILGRKGYGSPGEFAIARLTEAFIGLFCFIMVELLLQPTRAVNLAKSQLSQTLGTLRECIEEVVLCSRQKEMPTSIFQALREKQNRLKAHITELELFTGQAELEPDFWFLPFRVACYSKLLRSLSKMADLLHFMNYSMELLLQASQRCGPAWMEIQEHMTTDLDIFRKNVASSLKCLEKIALIKSLTVFEKEFQDKKINHNLELGKALKANVCILSTDEEEEKILNSFLQHSTEVTDQIHSNQIEEEPKSQMVLCLSALGFCISGLMREMKDIEREIRELIRWDNPTCCINFYEICHKIDSL